MSFSQCTSIIDTLVGQNTIYLTSTMKKRIKKIWSYQEIGARFNKLRSSLVETIKDIGIR